MASHANLKKLQLLKDKLELRKDDIAVSEAALTDEARELSGRKEQVDLVNARIKASVKEMEEIGRRGRSEKAERDEFAHEEDALRSLFNNTLDQEVKVLHAERERERELAAKAGAVETEMREVSVLFEDEEAVFRITDEAYTFDELCSDACRFFEVHPLDVMICDDQDEPWTGRQSVRMAMMQYDNAYGRIFLKFKQVDADEEAEAEDADNILQLLLKVEEQPEDDEDEDDEAEMAAAAAASTPGGAANGGSVEKTKKKKNQINRGLLLRELPVFMLFTVLFIYSLQSRRRVEAGYYQVQAIRTIMVEEGFGDFNEKSFLDIRNFEEVYDWIDNVLVEALYPDSKYNGDEFSSREKGSVMTYNRIVGAIRIRQSRSRPNVDCPGTTATLNRRKVMNSTFDVFDELFVSECHGRPSPLNEETRPFGPGVALVDEHGSCDAIPAPPPPPSAFLDNYGARPHARARAPHPRAPPSPRPALAQPSPSPHPPPPPLSRAGVPPTEEELQAMAVRKLCRAFTYSPAEVTQESPITGRYYTYPGGGYIRDIDNPVDCRERPETDPNPNPLGVCERGDTGRNDLLLAIAQLKSNLWMDEATRVVFITITFYNGNLGYFMVMTFIFEFTLGGTVIPRTKQSIINQEMYHTDEANLVITILEFITYAFVVYYTVVQVRAALHAVRKTGSIGPYFADVWNMLECIVLISFYMSTYLRLTLFFSRKPDPVIFENYFTDFGTIGNLWLETFNLDALCVLVLFFKGLKYAQLNLSMGMLWKVLSFAAKDILFFTLMLFTLLGGFSMMSLQLFGSSIEQYSSISQSVLQLLRVLLGEFDIEGMTQASPMMGIIFFFVYIVVMFLIMMNIFLAILGEAYTVVRAETQEILKARVKTRKRSLVEWFKLVRAVLKAKVAQRRAQQAGGGRRRRARIGGGGGGGGGGANGLLAADELAGGGAGGGVSKPGGKADARVTLADT